MPRLSNEYYYHRHEFLRWLWLNKDAAYSYLSPNEQWAIHDYYQPSKELSFQELVAHRREVSKERPNLPAVAGKAAHRLYQLVKGQRSPKPTHRPRQRQSSKRQVTIRAVVRPEINMKQLARALIAVAEDMARREQEKKPTGTGPNSPPAEAS